MCQVGPRQAASLPAESVFFSIEIKINSRGVHGNVLDSVMDIFPPSLSTLLTFLLNLLFFRCLASQQGKRPALTHACYRHYKHTCNAHTNARTNRPVKRQTSEAMHNRCVMTGLIWFHTVGHEALYGTEKRNGYMDLFNKSHNFV